jgi:hypothetical protein
LDHVRKVARSIMIRYSAYGGTNYRMKAGVASSELRRSLEVEYRDLLELRERVREAEAAAQRLKPRTIGGVKAPVTNVPSWRRVRI